MKLKTTIMKKILSLILIFSLSFVNFKKNLECIHKKSLKGFENMNWENKIITGNGKISVAQDIQKK